MIRIAKVEDLDAILQVYAAAKVYMRENGNATQWAGTYPERQLLEQDISLGNLYVCVKKEEICGVFALIFGEDSTYAFIENGQWPNQLPYATIHRIASNGRERGIFDQCMDFCKERTERLRLDTHADNRIMQYLADKHGFLRCGVIYVADGSARIAYHWERTDRGP